MCWVELLLVAIPYRADAVAERAGLTAEAARAWERARSTITDTLHDNPADLLPALLEGRWATAQRLARSTSANAAVGYFQGGIVALGVLARHQGAPAVAWARVRDLLPAGPATEPGGALFHQAIILQALAADLALDAGDPAAAGPWVEAHDRWLAYSGAVLWQADHHRLRARLAAASGDPAAARAHAEAGLARATEPRQPLALLAAHRLLGELDIAGGRHTEAAGHLAAALALAEACVAPYERALTLLALAELRGAEAQSAEAMACLAEARAILADLGAAPALARAEALADRLAAHQPAPSPTSAPTSLPFGLTAREAAVLALLAEGLTDLQIAARLFVSPHTVNGHTKAIYGKLGVTSRAAATRLALDHGLR
jgi:ATP/maltotriose-dependent transcriptional regulator MalT